MALSNGVISAPVNVKADVATLFGVTNYTLSYLCGNQHNKINPYSKYKPVILPHNGAMTDALFKEANWGYRIPEATNIATYIKGVRGTETPTQWAAPSGSYNKAIKWGWYYTPPTGSAAQPYRIGDFRGYNHNTGSTNAFGYVSAPAEITQNTTSMTIEADNGNFPFSMFGSLSDMHMGFAIVKQGSNTAMFKTNSTNNRITLDKTEITQAFPTSNATYTIYAFATHSDMQNLVSTYSNYGTNLTDVVPIPNTFASITYKYDSPTTGVSASASNAEISLDGKTLTYDMYMKNTQSSGTKSITTSNIKIRLYAIDDYGNEYSTTSGQYLPYTGTSKTVILQPGTNTLIQTSVSIDISAIQKVLVAPYTVTVGIYYPNTNNVLTFVGSGEATYE